MYNIIKKYISDNTGFLIRLDDIAENMNWDMMQKVSDLFDKYQIKQSTITTNYCKYK